MGIPVTTSSPRSGASPKGQTDLNWGRVRSIGSIRSLVVSFIVGLVVALPDLLGTPVTEYLKNPQIMAPTVLFFSSVGLAYLVFEFFCPTIIKRFQTAADFYEHQLSIKKLQMETYKKDAFEANLEHVKAGYKEALGKHPAAIYVTMVLYVIGFLAFVLMLVRLYQAIQVAAPPSSAFLFQAFG